MSDDNRGPGPSPDDTAPRNSQDYQVGYGRPPVHTRYRPGQSGYPKGRPKGRRNTRTILDEILGQPAKVRQGNRTRKRSTLEAYLLSLVARALQANNKEEDRLVTLLRLTGSLAEQPEAPKHEPVTEDDAAIVNDFLERHRGKVEIPTPLAEAPEPQTADALKKVKP